MPNMRFRDKLSRNSRGLWFSSFTFLMAGGYSCPMRPKGRRMDGPLSKALE